MIKNNKVQDKRSNKDQSPKIFQRGKIKEVLSIRDLYVLNPTQQGILSCALDKETQIIIIDGVAGTGKTFLAVLAALQLLNAKRVGDIVFIRSLIQAKDGETGFLSGDLSDKTYYYNIPLFDKLEELLPKNELDVLITENRIITYPTAMLRGYNFNVSAVILDEAQNCHIDSIRTVMTRIGKFSKLFILGDTTNQNDYGNKSGFLKCCHCFSDQESEQRGIRYFKLDYDHIVRNPLISFILKKLDDV